MACSDWNNLPPELVLSIGQRLSSLVDCLRFGVICKSWRNVLVECQVPTTSENIWLLLAEEVAPGVLYDDCEYDPNQDYGDTDEDTDVSEDNDEGEEEADGSDDTEKEEVDSSGDTDEEAEEESDHSGNTDEEEEEDGNIDAYEEGGLTSPSKYYLEEEAKYNYLNNSIGSSRGLYNLLTGKTYTIDLPEAAGRLIFGLSKGWILTLGRDLQINLLHPLLKHHISLPPMLTLPRQYDYHENFQPEEAADRFIRKAAISFEPSTSLYHHHTFSPTVMASYGICGFLGFTKLGDKVWTDVNVPAQSFHDVIYHNGNFYAVNAHGDVYVCVTDGDEEGGELKGRKIASVKTNDWDQKYLVGSSSGSGLLLLVRYRKIKYFEDALCRWPKYRTTKFSAWKLNLIYSDSPEDILCTETKVNDLGSETLFVGRSSSISVSSSQTIKPNCIYFTDDNWVEYLHRGGGHDMGIFNMEHGTTEPHFQGKSIHPISPPVWYF